MRVDLMDSMTSVRRRIASELANVATVRLVARGRVLPEEGTLEEAGIIGGSTVYFVANREALKVTVVVKDREARDVCIGAVDTVEALKGKIAEIFQLGLEEVTLVHAGVVLAAPLSIAGAGITEGAVIRAVVRTTREKKGKFAHMIDVLYNRLSDLFCAPRAEQDKILDDIYAAIENPILRSYTRIDRDARQLVDDATIILESADLPRVSKKNHVIAKINDNAMNQFEYAIECIRPLRSVYIPREPGRPTSGFTLNTKRPPSINDSPLPAWWGTTFQRVGVQHNGTLFVCERFGPEVRALKKLGFHDEQNILTALRETSGNISRAVAMLMKGGF